MIQIKYISDKINIFELILHKLSSAFINLSN